MIVRFDRSGGLTTDQKLQSLASSVQLALNELMTEQEKINRKLEELSANQEEISTVLYELKSFVDGDALLMRGE